MKGEKTSMTRYFIIFSYKGTAYSGWQIQPNGVTVQEIMQKAFSTVLRSTVELTAAGRTDAGVHAKKMIAHVDLSMGEEQMPQLVNKLNSILPADIAVHNFVKVNKDAHARFDASSRVYEYHLIVEKNVFLYDYAMRSFNPLDFDKMNKAAEILFEYEDFTSFSKLHTDAKTNNCKIYHAKWEDRGDRWVFKIEANRFLRDMVRAIVGTLLEVGRGKHSLEDFKNIIESKNRSKAGASVPAKGLYLCEVKYPFLKEQLCN